MIAALGMAEAQAGACCVGASPGRSGRLPESDLVGGSIGYSVETRPGVWTRRGDLQFTERDLQFTHTWTPQLLLRPTRLFQTAVALPILVNANRFGDDVHVGGGLGDLSLTFRWEPVAVGPWRSAPPLPGIGLGISIPTGRSTAQIDDGNSAAVTGAGHLALIPSFSLDKAYVRGAIGGDLALTISVPRPDDPDRTVPGVGFSGAVFGAFYASEEVTVTSTIGVRAAGRGRSGGHEVGSPSIESFGGVGLVLEPRPKLRISLGVQGTVPIPKLGAGRAVSLMGSMGVSFSLPRPSSSS